MFKYLQRFPFAEKNRFFYQAFEEVILEPNGLVRNLKNIVGLHGQSDLIKNIFGVIDGEIPKTEYKTKNQFLQKWATDCYKQRFFYNYICSEKNKSFITKLKLPRNKT